MKHFFIFKLLGLGLFALIISCILCTSCSQSQQSPLAGDVKKSTGDQTAKNSQLAIALLSANYSIAANHNYNSLILGEWNTVGKDWPCTFKSDGTCLFGPENHEYYDIAKYKLCEKDSVQYLVFTFSEGKMWALKIASLSENNMAFTWTGKSKKDSNTENEYDWELNKNN